MRAALLLWPLEGVAQKAEACPVQVLLPREGWSLQTGVCDPRCLIGRQSGTLLARHPEPGGFPRPSPSSHVHGLASSASPGPLGGICISRIKLTARPHCPHLLSYPLIPKGAFDKHLSCLSGPLFCSQVHLLSVSSPERGALCGLFRRTLIPS